MGRDNRTIKLDSSNFYFIHRWKESLDVYLRMILIFYIYIVSLFCIELNIPVINVTVTLKI